MRPSPSTVRKKLGLSQGQLAKLLGTTQSSISKWERGEVPLSGALQRLYFLFWHDPSLAYIIMRTFKPQMPGQADAQETIEALGRGR